jgi:LysM repeat protein
MRKTEINVILIALAIIFFVTIMTIALLQSTLVSNIVNLAPTNTPADPALLTVPTPSSAIRPLTNTDMSATITLQNTALGFSLDYPASWRKKETTLYTILSPSAAGLNPTQFQDSALWIGISAQGTVDPIMLLNEILGPFAPTTLKQTQLTIGEKRWEATHITFEAPELGGEGRATVAATAHNEVGYFIISVAAAQQWSQSEPTFERILDSFHFLQQAVLRPTDATPPPTPTPTPTPVVYVVQSGDTLGGIAVRYGVDLQALMNRNDIDDPRRLRSGQQLIIPIKRQ